MQTPKKRDGSSEVPQRTSSATSRTARQLKMMPGSDSDAAPPPDPANRTTPKGRKAKADERKSSGSPVAEGYMPEKKSPVRKKRGSKVSELESQIAQLQEELKKARDQLSSSESWKKRAQQEAEEAREQLAAMSAKLEESHQQLIELSASDEARVQELRKISQERDRAWQSELEAVQRKYSMDYAALRLELTETLSLVEKLKTELSDCKDSEAQALELVRRTQMQMEMAKTNEEALRSEGVKAMDAYRSLAAELEESKAQVNSLEELVGGARENVEDECLNQLKAELDRVKFEAGQLRSALDAAERRYKEEYIQSTLQIRSAYELVERSKSESSLREAELKSELKKAEADLENLKANLMDRETKSQSICEEEIHSSERESKLEMEMKKFEVDLADLKGQLLDKETELQLIIEENEMLKMEIKKREMERDEESDKAVASAEAARVAGQEALLKVGYLTEEADKSSREAAHVNKQLDAAQAANSEMEAELRKLKVQADQWRKAAEAATAMLSTGGHGRFSEREWSLDGNYHTIGGALASPFPEDIDDESPKSKNGSMLKKIGVLLKKGQK